ncbi:MAG: hypothetical protein NTX22_07290 [Ignavibacteriales bacterium]|nr:hypothetical protein [Ignavibacteriales bacterium]
MKQHLLKIKSIKKITYAVLQNVTENPQQFTFNCAQTTEVSINKLLLYYE